MTSRGHFVGLFSCQTANPVHLHACLFITYRRCANLLPLTDVVTASSRQPYGKKTTKSPLLPEGGHSSKKGQTQPNNTTTTAVCTNLPRVSSYVCCVRSKQIILRAGSPAQYCYSANQSKQQENALIQTDTKTKNKKRRRNIGYTSDYHNPKA